MIQVIWKMNDLKAEIESKIAELEAEMDTLEAGDRKRALDSQLDGLYWTLRRIETL